MDVDLPAVRTVVNGSLPFERGLEILLIQIRPDHIATTCCALGLEAPSIPVRVAKKVLEPRVRSVLEVHVVHPAQPCACEGWHLRRHLNGNPCRLETFPLGKDLVG